MPLMAWRLWFWAAVVRPLKHVVPLRTLVHLLHRSPRSSRNGRAVQVRRDIESFFERTGRPPRRAPANCLERSLGAYRLLCSAGAAPEIVVGIRRGVGGRVDGHVWVVVEGRPLGEDEAFIAGYARVLAFDATGLQVPGSADRLPGGVRLLS
jgi:hypothetical protein